MALPALRTLASKLAALAFVAHAAAGCALDDGTTAAPETQWEFDLSGTPGLPEPTTLAEGAFRALAVSSPYLYTVSDGAVVRVSSEDGTVEPISGALPSPPYPLAADSEHLYGAVFVRPFHTELWRIPLARGAFDAQSGALLLGSAQSSVALGVTASYLVSLEARPSPSTLTRKVTRFDKEGGGSEVLATFTSVVTDGFALDDLNAYVTRGAVDLDHTEIVRVPLDGGEPAVLLSAPADTFRSLDVTADEVAFASLTRVGRVPVDGGAAVTTSSKGGYLVFADPEYTYYFTWEPGCASGSILYRAAASGEHPVAIAHEPVPGCIRDAVADAGAVYWITSDGALLRKANKQ